MGREVTTTCDSCDKDLSDNDGMPDYRLHLKSERIPNKSNFEYAVMCYPDIKSDKFFCGLECMYKWLKKKPK